MTREELAKFDGREGRKAYGAVNGKIYDFSSSKMWQGGNHQELHQAGHDLTDELKSAPHVRAVIERFPVVGQLEEPGSEAGSGGSKAIFGIIAAVVILVVLFLVLR
ncbi:cytochrome b5 domain-containing protein [Desulfuromonas sp. AOP6]|uniref:cytochrome b5 domain-containing protein n=1 Tax=Desulfuromonas sp. AOP6 TaxID=1566351 RepID=UPI0012791D55|nr:cytochrome b5 domain-containing protein [Desulfuromonas sp. AOP6]BCA78651.1 cytochrome b5 [Desulfuromonas sp. AOP6]